jgi:hypothetical protein
VPLVIRSLFNTMRSFGGSTFKLFSAQLKSEEVDKDVHVAIRFMLRIRLSNWRLDYVSDTSYSRSIILTNHLFSLQKTEIIQNG